jgi:hypothetical protein
MFGEIGSREDIKTLEFHCRRSHQFIQIGLYLLYRFPDHSFHPNHTFAFDSVNSLNLNVKICI